MHRGFAKLYRKLKEWEWYKDGPVKELYIHFLLSANHKDGSYKGQPIPRGSLISGRKSLSAQTSLSEQQIRRAINALESTGYIRSKTTSKSTMFTVIDFDTYNDYDAKSNQQTTSETTNKQPSSNQVATTNKNDKNVKNEKNVNNYSAEFEQFWSAYPKKKAKKAAHKAFKNAKDKPSVVGMIAAIEAQKRSREWIEGYIPNPATWLNGGSWDDETQTSMLPSTRQPELKDKF
jgi:DNA-binding transcriptional MocR family regulator